MRPPPVVCGRPVRPNCENSARPSRYKPLGRATAELVEETTVGPEESRTRNTPGGVALEISPFCSASRLETPEAFNPCEVTCRDKTPMTSGAAKLRMRFAEFALTPLDFATASETRVDLLPKIRLTSCWPRTAVLDAELPLVKRAEGLLTTLSNPPSRRVVARPDAPSGEDVIRVSPFRTVGTALNNDWRVADSGSPIAELAWRTTSGVR